MRTLPISNNGIQFNNSFRADEDSPKVTNPDILNPNKPEAKKDNKTLPIVTSALALAALVTSGVAIVKTRGAGKDEAIKGLKEELNSTIRTLEEKLSAAKDSSDKAKLEEELKNLKDLVEEKVKWFDGFNKGTLESFGELRGKLDAIGNSMIEAGIGERGMIHIDGLQLMQNMTTDKAKTLDPQKDKALIQFLKTISGKYQRGEVALKKLKKGDAIWSISTETKWRGTGGQGEIFTQQAKNFNEVGVKSYSILGGNRIPGLGGIHHEGGKHFCTYKKENIELKEIANYQIDVYRNGKHSLEPVTVYTGTSPISGEQMLIFDNPKYFSSNMNIYNNSAGGVTERERATFLGKAAYTFEKLIRDPNSVPGRNIVDPELFKSIKAPDAVYLHDTAAAPYLLAARLKAPLEAANGELSADAANAISEKNIVAKSHNFDYRGESYGAERSDILNTLLDKYAADIYRYAETGFAEEGMIDIGKVATSGDSVSFANWMLSLANDIENVSHTDLLERVEGKVNQARRSGSCQHILATRFKYGTIHGHGNSWDRSVNEVSVAKLPMYNNMINQDIVAIMQAEVKKIKSALTESEQKLLDFKDVNINNFNDVVEVLRKLDNPEVNKTLAKLDADGVTKLRQYVPYVQSDSIETIMNARKQNKMLFIEQLRTMIKYNKEYDEKLFKIAVPEDMNLDSINMENIDDVMIASFGCRLVEQKNVPLLTKAIKEIQADFAQKYPGKKLITVIGGPDDTADKVFHNMLSKDLGNNISRLEFTPNPIYQSASDFTLRTSEFEPDGDLAESLYKGTPVIVTRVGGYVDRILGTNKGILADRTPAQVVEAREDMLLGMTKDYKEALFKGADIFFNDKAKYQNMVRECIDSEYSWIVKDAEGKITRDCGVARDLKMLGYDLDTFPEFAKEVAEAVK